MPAEGLQALRERVYGDAALALRLRSVDPALFIAEVVRVSSELGYEVTDADVTAALAHAQREWTLRWVR